MCKHFAGRHDRKNSILCDRDESIDKQNIKQNIMYPFLLTEKFKKWKRRYTVYRSKP
jgi:hypothetical protein